MALQLKDRVRTACTTIGKAEIEIGAVRAGFQNWDGITDGNTVYYCVVEGNKWEVGYGVKTGTEITRNLLSSSTGSLLSLDGTSDVFETYPAEKAVILNTDNNIQLSSSNITASKFIGDGSALTNIPTSADTYTKSEIDTQQSAQDTKIVINNDEIARQQIEITGNSSAITKNVLDINSNTTAIGTLSGQVSQNSEDIEELQDSIFFTSAYSADYPSSPNRDPENGNMYLQNVALFTYSYASATQIFCSKTDESGNVRQFTAVKPGDSIVLNEVDSPNYGRYELVTVEDVSDSYVVMNVIPKMGQGTVITGVKVAFQAFPQPGGGTGEGTVADGCIYLNNQTITADYTIPTGKNGMSAGAIKFDGTVTVPTGSAYHVVDSDEDSLWTESGGDTVKYTSTGNTTVLAEANSGKYATYQVDNADQKYSMQIRPDQANAFVIRNETTSQNLMTIATDGGVSTKQDITVNGIRVGMGGGAYPIENNTVVGNTALGSNITGTRNTAFGTKSLQLNTEGNQNTAIGSYALQSVTTGSVNTAVGDSAISGLTEGSENIGVGNGCLTGLSTGSSNTALGRNAGSELTTGSNNTCIGYQAQPSSPTVTNEVTIGNDSVTKTRLIGAVTVGNATWDGGGTDGLGIQASRNDSSPFAFYIKNSDNDLLTSVRCNGDTNINGVLETAQEMIVNGFIKPNAIPALQPLDSNTRIYTQAGVGAIYDSYTHNFRVGPSGSTVGLKVSEQGNVIIGGGLNIANPGTSTGIANCVLGGDGTVYRTTNVSYSTQDVDKMLATKDKIIEALEARLTKLEARIK